MFKKKKSAIHEWLANFEDESDFKIESHFINISKTFAAERGQTSTF